MRRALPPYEAKVGKYKNKRTEVDGIKFASKAEAKRYSELKLLERQEYVSNIRLQPRYKITVLGKTICTYVADFEYMTATGLVVEDVKGVRTDVFKLKAKLFEAIYGFSIREVKA